MHSLFHFIIIIIFERKKAVQLQTLRENVLRIMVSHEYTIVDTVIDLKPMTL